MFTAEQEFEFVAQQLTDKELRQLDYRLTHGRVEGFYYVGTNCGCFYGWIGQLRGVLDKDAGLAEGHDFRDSLLGKNGGYITNLETFVSYIHLDDTPSNNTAAAWLHNLIKAELKRRKEQQHVR